MNESQNKPWYKSITLIGVLITAVAHFLFKLSHHLPEIFQHIVVFLGLLVTVIGRVLAEKPIGK